MTFAERSPFGKCWEQSKIPSGAGIIPTTFPWLIKEEKVRYVVIPFGGGRGRLSETFSAFPSVNPKPLVDK